MCGTIARWSVKRTSPCDVLDRNSSSNVDVDFKRKERQVWGRRKQKRRASPSCTLKLPAPRPAQRPHKASGVILIPEWLPHYGTLCRARRWGHRWQVCCHVTARKHRGRQRNKCKACLDRTGGPCPAHRAASNLWAAPPGARVKYQEVRMQNKMSVSTSYGQKQLFRTTTTNPVVPSGEAGTDLLCQSSHNSGMTHWGLVTA